MQKGDIYIWKGSIIIERKGYEEETGEYQQYSENSAPKIDNRLPLNSILAVDYMIIQGILFMHSISNNIKFRTAESINGKKPYKKDILAAISRVLNLYKTRGFQVKQINGDNEFMCISNEVLPVNEYCSS